MGVVHAAKAPPSTAHSNVLPGSSAEKANVASVATVTAGGCTDRRLWRIGVAAVAGIECRPVELDAHGRALVAFSAPGPVSGKLTLNS